MHAMAFAWRMCAHFLALHVTSDAAWAVAAATLLQFERVHSPTPLAGGTPSHVKATVTAYCLNLQRFNHAAV
jgi:hypothetical protein